MTAVHIEKIIDNLKISNKDNLFYKNLIIKELSSDKQNTISFLLNTDEIYFLYILEFLEDIILNNFDKNFIMQLKKKVFKRYNKILNRNMGSYEEVYRQSND